MDVQPIPDLPWVARPALDHILLTDVFRSSYDIVHVNAEFADQASDHDPQVVRIGLP